MFGAEQFKHRIHLPAVKTLRVAHPMKIVTKQLLAAVHTKTASWTRKTRPSMTSFQSWQWVSGSTNLGGSRGSRVSTR